MVPPSDSDILAGALIEMLGKPENEISLLGKTAREKMVENYGLQKVVARYGQLYEQILQERG